MEQFILNVLSGYGLAGVVILGLGWAVLQQWRTANRINETRLNERDVLIQALQNNTQATKDNAVAIALRNEVTEELSKTIEKQALIIELFMQKMEIHDTGLKEKLSDFKLTVDSIAEASRVNTGVLREVRDRVSISGDALLRRHD